VPGGYHGRALRVDLATGTTSEIPLPEETLRAFLGGVGLGTRLLLSESRAGADPLGPDAVLVVALSPLVGTPLTTSAKFAVVAKSPLTDRIGDALSSDRFAIELKRCGVDALVLAGRARRPSVVVVGDDGARLEDAGDAWGLPARDAEARLEERFGPGSVALSCGPAGERLVRFATLSSEGRHAGRGGLGAVLGSMRVKAVVARGTKATPLADAEGVLSIAKDVSRRSLGPATAKYRELGTVANVLMLNRLGAMPTRNYAAGSFEGAERVSGEALHAASPSIRRHCAACTIGCEHVFDDGEGRGVRLEYEGLFALGPLCGIADREAVLRAAGLCDELGIDVISAGATVAFAMECAEKGLLDGGPAGDRPRFGDAATLLATLRSIGTRSTPLGDLLAEGSRRAAARLGRGADRLAVHVKGMELPGYDPRALQTLAVGYAVSARGADHNRSGAYEADLSPATDRLRADAGKGALAARSEDRAALLDSLVLCKFLRGALPDLEGEAAAMLSAVTGWDVDAEELRAVARRVVIAKKAFNVREGWTRAEDTLPPRVLDEALPLAAGSEARLTREGLDAMVVAYYRARGWSDDGAVPDEALREAGLDGLVASPACARPG
jgi:aldehyde:ferredoxin oxidoreductase